MNTTQSTSPPPSRRTALRIVCGVDASNADETAVRAACEMAGRHGHIALVCALSARGAGLTAQAPIEPARASEALERAMKQARDAGVPASVHIVRTRHAADAILRAAADGDVLVVGTHRGGRAGGITLGRVATTALHKSTVPVLVARPLPETADETILLASDGSPSSSHACAFAARLAAERDASVILFTAGAPADAEARHALSLQAARLQQATGHEPTIATGSGKAADAIVDAATSTDASFVVVGNRGRTGLRALGSVSERVAHRAPCSVIVVRPPAG